MIDEVHPATPEHLEKAMRTILVPAGYRYVHPVSCLAGANIWPTSGRVNWKRIWSGVDRRVDSSCASGELRLVERADWFPCADRSPVCEQALL